MYACHDMPARQNTHSMIKLYAVLTDLHVGAPDIVQDLCLADIDMTQNAADGRAQHRLVSGGTSNLQAG